MLGGSSSMNAMIYMRGRPSDYDGWEAMGAKGWGWDDVFPRFLEVEDNVRGASAHHGVGGELRVEEVRDPSPFTRRFIESALELGVPANDDFNGPIQEGVGPFQVTQHRGRRWGAFEAFLRPARSRPTLDVVTDALVLRVIVDGGKAVGVSFVEGGEIRTVKADAEVVLAAGAIGSPVILQRSGIGPPAELEEAGVTPLVELVEVGRNLQDHAVAMVLHRSSQGGTLDDAESLPNLVRWLLTRRGSLSSNVAEAGAFVRTSHAGFEPDLQFHFGPVYFADHGLSPFEGNAYTTGPLLLNPSSRGRVRIRTGDPFQKPEIIGNYLTEPEDVPPLIEGLELAREILNAHPFDVVRDTEMFPGPDVSTRTQLTDYLRNKVELLYHPVGTCRIGPEDDGVVDPELRVYGVDNLRVADASVMPKIVSGNTNAPTMMIATKAASLITGT